MSKVPKKVKDKISIKFENPLSSTPNILFPCELSTFFEAINFDDEFPETIGDSKLSSDGEFVVISFGDQIDKIEVGLCHIEELDDFIEKLNRIKKYWEE